MRVIIVGASKVGYALTKHICDEGFDVIVIDEDAASVDDITDRFDCNGYVGNGGSPRLLKKAGIDTASVFIAVTKEDETNIMCCNVAKQLGVRRTIAAVRSPQYAQDKQFFSEKLGVDMLINPDMAAAVEVSKQIKYAGTIEIERFGDGNVNVATVAIENGSVLADVMMPEVQTKLGAQALICAIERGGKLITPKGKSQIKVGDKITFAAIGEEMDKALKALDLIEKVVRKVVVVGGSKVGYYLAEMLTEQGVKVTIVDNDTEHCRELLEKIPKADVVNADGTDTEFMEKVLKGIDACVVVSGEDEVNLIISMYAKSLGLDRISAEIDNGNYEKMLKKSGIDHVFSTQNIALGDIIKDTRLMAAGENKVEGNLIKWMYTFSSGRVEALEFDVEDDFKLMNIAFRDTKFALKPGVLIAMIVRAGEAIVPDGNSCICHGDRIIVVSSEQKISKLSDILA